MAFLLEKRCTKAIVNKLDFKKARAFKRSNSNGPNLPVFGDLEDLDNIAIMKNKMKNEV